MIPNCDKNVPGLLMAAARLNIPSIFVSGGPMLAGTMKKKRISYSTVSEAVSRHQTGEITAEELAALGEGGLCLNCSVCTYPNCGFGKGW